LKQSAGLALDGPEVRLGIQLQLLVERELDGLAADDASAALGQDAMQVRARLRLYIQSLHRGKGKHKHDIAGVDRLRHAVTYPGGGLSAPHTITILNVIVNQGSIVQHFA